MLKNLERSRIKYKMEQEVKAYAAALKIVRKEVDEARALFYGTKCKSPKVH
jgi:hypothetical protein